MGVFIGISLFLVEDGMPGFKKGRKLNKIGFKAQDTAELFFDDVRLPASALLGKANKGFYYLMQVRDVILEVLLYCTRRSCRTGLHCNCIVVFAGVAARASPDRGSRLRICRIHVRRDTRIREKPQGVRPHVVAPAGVCCDRHDVTKQ